MTDPVRWSEDPDAPEGVGELLRAGRGRRPPALDDRSRAAVAAALAAGGGALPPPASSGPLTLKIGAGVAGLVSLGAIAVLGARLLAPPSPPAAPTRLAPAETVEAPSEPAPVAPPVEAPIEETPPPEPAPVPRTLAPVEVDADPLATELALVRSAHSELATSPRRALRLTAEHERRFPAGMLIEERELIAIDALARLGRLGRARARRDRLAARFPGSAYLARADEILSSAAE